MFALVSVIIPVYKVEKYLDRCVESIVNQTYKNLEIILVDDGSPDNCPRICDAWAEKDDRIKVIHKENAGMGMARNSGLETATGEYLMFVDSDDYLSENAVEVLYERMVVDGSDMAVGKHADVYDDGTINDTFCRWMENDVLTKNEVLSRMGKKDRIVVMACMKMYKKEVFKELRFPTLKCGEDCWIFPEIMEQCSKISIVDELVYHYYQRSDSILHQLSDERLMDDLKANLKLSRYLFECAHYEGANKWLERSLDKRQRLIEKKGAKEIIKNYYGKKEINILLKSANSSMRLKWICLHVPGMYPVLHLIKQKWRKCD